MFVKFSLAVALVALTATAASADVTFKYVSAAESKKSAEAPKVPGQAQAYIADGPDFHVYVAERNKPGQVEQHADWNDELIILDGSVLLNYGGTSVGAKDTGPGEKLGDRIEGGKSVTMHSGDIVTIPAGMPHQMLIQTPTMRYVVFKTRTGH